MEQLQRLVKIYKCMKRSRSLRDFLSRVEASNLTDFCMDSREGEFALECSVERNGRVHVWIKKEREGDLSYFLYYQRIPGLDQMVAFDHGAYVPKSQMLQNERLFVGTYELFDERRFTFADMDKSWGNCKKTFGYILRTEFLKWGQRWRVWF